MNNCLSSFFKYLLYFLNLVFVFSGVFLIVFGALMLNGLGNFTKFDGATVVTFPITFIVIGSVTFLVAFFGCCGTIRESACLTKIYAICMLILFGLQMALSIWLFVEKDTFLDFMSGIVDKAWRSNDEAHGYPMDALQIALKCCGNEDYKQYGGHVPASCCGYEDRLQECSEHIYSHRPGCNDAFLDFWISHMDVVRLNSLIIALFQLGIFFISCHLARAMRWN
ncbi:23 kDa integral membrane protein-like [Drosophila bipectinata]|uniref:23 kDa integral membrane protein-like n=1 Tax=Drosophila bipectinata TaxID=42026 RepID=UPI001C8AA9D0|nr:23 kDa integral membrane protein-like [Drosophila bipectinata]